MVPKLHCCNSGSKSNIVFLVFFVLWAIARSIQVVCLSVSLNREMSFLLCYSLALSFTAIPVFLELV